MSKIHLLRHRLFRVKFAALYSIDEDLLFEIQHDFPCGWSTGKADTTEVNLLAL